MTDSSPSKNELSTPVYKHLNGVESWDSADKTVRTAFYRAMKGRAYGWEPTLDAWCWFLTGWTNPLASETPAAPDDFAQWVEQWAQAYPLDVFPEPNFQHVREALSAVGLSLDCVSASNMRHVITRVRDKLRDAEKTPATQSKFDLAFEIMRQLDAENMDTMQSCHFGYVLRVERERVSEKTEPVRTPCDDCKADRERLCEAIRIAMSSFQSHGFQADADELEEVLWGARHPNAPSENGEEGRE